MVGPLVAEQKQVRHKTVSDLLFYSGWDTRIRT